MIPLFHFVILILEILAMDIWLIFNHISSIPDVISYYINRINNILLFQCNKEKIVPLLSWVWHFYQFTIEKQQHCINHLVPRSINVTKELKTNCMWSHESLLIPQTNRQWALTKQTHKLLRSAVGIAHVLWSGLVMGYTTSYFPLIVLRYHLDSNRS